MVCISHVFYMTYYEYHSMLLLNIQDKLEWPDLIVKYIHWSF